MPNLFEARVTKFSKNGVMLNFHFWTVKIMFQAPKSGETIKPEDAYY
jgi:hypothetical protein